MSIDKLKEVVNTIEFEKQKMFAKYSLLRVVNLYKLFEKMIESENLEAMPIVNGVEILHNIAENMTNYSDNEELNNKIAMCEELIPDYEDYGGIETSLAISVASATANSLEFVKTKDIKLLYWMIDEVVEVVRFIASEKYQSEQFAEEREEMYINEAVVKEVDILKNVVKLIDEGDNFRLAELVKNTSVQFFKQ